MTKSHIASQDQAREPSRVRQRVSGALARVPHLLWATGSRAWRGVESLETMPDGTLRSLAAASLAFGAGLSFSRAGRLAAVAGAVPAVVMGTVLITRPATRRGASGTAR